ncbi:uncharacterized protein LOC119742860 [Patiria miniata]|uniref:Septin-type G domain-containing protein n=1 Tax=Patiria miniata TaxID=46514 RepID=A0A914BFZ2_PATMI|nr:uncharacterized protein LOC119742860 [Patiria miniata]
MSTASASDSPNSKVRYAEQLLRSSRKVSAEVGNRDVFLVPSNEESVSTTQAFHSYNVGLPSGMPSHNKVIMVVGATGAGKSTQINAMINYILGVKWEDNFRFKLVHEPGNGTQSQADSQTQNISSYTIHSNDHINVPYTLTIIDTPGFGHTKGIKRDKAIVEQIREFFSHPENHGVDHIDAVSFVVQASQARLTPTQQYIFDSILSIFGKDIEPNILLLITFSDGQTPKVLEAVKKAKLPFGKTFKFNNSALLASRGDGGISFDKMFWQMGYTSMKDFFDALDHLQPRSLTLTREVLEERIRLEIALEGIQPQIHLAGDYRGNCNVCPGKCSSGVHVKERFRYQWKTMRVKQTYADIQNRYLDAQGRKQDREAVIKGIEADLANAEDAVDELIQESHRCAQRLEQIALKPNPLGIEEYLDVLIETEKSVAAAHGCQKLALLLP